MEVSETMIVLYIVLTIWLTLSAYLAGHIVGGKKALKDLYLKGRKD